jgi:hypothetical protein
MFARGLIQVNARTAQMAANAPIREKAMPITSILILAAIVGAFAIFGIALAWGEHQTRTLKRDAQPAAVKVPARATDAARAQIHDNPVIASRDHAAHNVVSWMPPKTGQTSARLG